MNLNPKDNLEYTEFELLLPESEDLISQEILDKTEAKVASRTSLEQLDTRFKLHIASHIQMINEYLNPMSGYIDPHYMDGVAPAETKTFLRNPGLSSFEELAKLHEQADKKIHTSGYLQEIPNTFVPTRKRLAFIGSGLYNASFFANLQSSHYNFKAHVYEKREHIGGNCYTRLNEQANCHEHVYGPHIFHTNSKEIWDFVNKYAEFNNFTYRPKAFDGKKLHSLPFNLNTIATAFGEDNISPERAKALITQNSVEYQNLDENASIEAWCLRNIGPCLYEKLVKNYTEKQWGTTCDKLPASIIKRLPLRFTFDDNYFNDKYQGIPINGYTKMIEAMFDFNIDGSQPNGTSFFFNTKMQDKGDINWFLEHYDHIIYTGPIDELFDYCYGHLEYRSLKHETFLLDQADSQGVAVINDTSPGTNYTRKIEHKHFNPEREKTNKTLLTYEFPKAWNKGDIEFYPVNTFQNQEQYHLYKELLDAQPWRDRITIGGRLGTYKYYDMHQVIGQALKDSNQLIMKENSSTR